MNTVLKIGINLNRLIMIVTGVLFGCYAINGRINYQILALISAIVLGAYQVLLALTLLLTKNNFKPLKGVFLVYFVSVLIYLFFFFGFLWKYIPFYNEYVLSVIPVFLALYITFFMEKKYAENRVERKE
ncbi:hypothetical protein [Tenacibaculum sp. M341]|uniref:hypothetical protein n=1 Tax=Tenacibaculum sp. M341 TaxID=2530339 RepID=UPI00104B93AF|nr:hypothetical protein [Tenacibaculum sp. M341]TCI85176.1 hypothetical protein EYW44_17860 [Tenacibaculum sp. M341]